MLESALALVAPTGLLTGIFYYFGYVSSRAFYAYFGISVSTLDLSSNHYFAQSVDTAFRPFATLLLVTLVALFAHRVIEHALSTRGSRLVRAFVVGLIVASTALMIVGLTGLYSGSGGVPSALSLASAMVLLEYALWAAFRYAALPARTAATIDAGHDLRRGVIIALVLTATFWGITDLAHERGVERARLVEQSLPIQAQAVVYSERDLRLPGPKVGVTSLEGSKSAYAFRYNGLRLLLYARDRWFLLPAGWTHVNGDTVIVLQDDPSRIRVDLAPGR